MSGAPLLLRAAAEADRPELLRIRRRAVEATHGFLSPSDVDEIEVRVRTLALPALTVTVAERTGSGPLGWIGVHGTRVEALFVDPAAHRQGGGPGPPPSSGLAAPGGVLLVALAAGVVVRLLGRTLRDPRLAGAHALGLRLAGRGLQLLLVRLLRHGDLRWSWDGG